MRKTILFLIILVGLSSFTFATQDEYHWETNELGLDIYINFNDGITDRLGGCSPTTGGDPEYNTTTNFSSGKSMFFDGNDYLDLNWRNIRYIDNWAIMFHYKSVGVVPGGDATWCGCSDSGYPFFRYSFRDLVDDRYVEWWYATNADDQNHFYSHTNDGQFDGDWHCHVIQHKAGTDNNDTAVYIDGIWIEPIFDENTGLQDIQLLSDLFFMAENESGTVTRYLTGNLDNLGISNNSILTYDQIERWCNGSYGIDTTPPTFDEIPHNRTLGSNVDSLYIDINASDNIAVDKYFTNDTTNFNITQSGELRNNTPLPISTYYINISVNDTSNNINSIVLKVTVVGDAIEPSINFTMPTQGTGNITNNDYIEVNVTASDLNLDDIIINIYNSTGLYKSNVSSSSPFYWKASNLPDGIYFINATANDTYSNTNSTETRNITIDTTSPIIIPLQTLLNNQTIVYNGTFATNINFSDEREIYSINVTFANGTIIFNQTNMGITSYELNISYGVDGTVSNSITARVCDAHTLSNIKDIKNKADKQGIKYIMKSKYIFFADEWVHIYPKDFSKYDRPKTTKGRDRYAFTFNKKTSPVTETFVVESSHYIDIAKLQSDNGHLVIPNIGKNGYWVDFENKEATKYTIKRISSTKVEVTVYGLKDKQITFNSIGELNCVTKTYYFGNLNPVESYTSRVMIRGTNTFYLNLTEDPNTMTTVNATLYYNNVPYYGGIISNFSVDVTAPAIGDILNKSIQFNWVINIDGVDYNLTTCNQTVDNKIIDNCSNASFSNNVALIVKYIDTSSLLPAKVNVSIIATGDVSYTNSFYNVENFSLCAYPSYATFSENIKLKATLGDATAYFINDTYLTNQTKTWVIYAPEGGETTIFTIKDSKTFTLLSGVYSTMYKLIGGSWATVASKYTDFTGRVQFNYAEGEDYKFFLTKSGYGALMFELTPILFGSYDVLMEKNVSLNTSQDYDKIALTYSPTIFYNDRETNFTFNIHCPYAELTGYGYGLSFPGGTSNESGSVDIGEELTSNFTITGATSTDRLRLDYYYQTDIAGRRTFTYYYEIITATGNYTMIANRDKTYGLGLVERVLVSVFIVLLTVGIATLVGQPVPGMGIGLLMYFYLCYVGFVPLWSVLISITIGLIILGSRQGD